MVTRYGPMLGAIIGALGWLIGFTVLCVVTGNLGFLAKIFYPGLVISLGMGLTFIVVLQLLPQPPGVSGISMTTMWGTLSFGVGVMWFLLNHWVAPLIDADPKMITALNAVGGYYKTGDLMPYAFLTTGVILLGVVAVRFPTTGKKQA